MITILQNLRHILSPARFAILWQDTIRQDLSCCRFGSRRWARSPRIGAFPPNSWVSINVKPGKLAVFVLASVMRHTLSRTAGVSPGLTAYRLNDSRTLEGEQTCSSW